MTSKELLDRLKAEEPAYWEWLQSKPNALQKVKAMAAGGGHWPSFYSGVKDLKSYGTWLSGFQVDDDEPPDETPPDDEGILDPTEPPEPTPPVPGAVYNGDGTWTLPNGSVIDAAGKLVGSPEILATLTQFLQDNELPVSLIGFIREALEQAKPYAQIIAELRQTPEYKAAYPENDIRLANGLSWMPESEIRAYRDEARRITFEYWGVDVLNSEIANLIGRGTSLRQWEHALQVYDLVSRYGEAVQAVFTEYTGVPLTEERLHAFMDPDFATPELDRTFALAQQRGIPAEYGFGIRPEEEVLALEQMGIDPNRVIENYRQIAGELPRFERLAAIGRYLDTNGGDFFGDVSVSGSLLFRAIQFGDPEAIRELQRRSSEEAARYAAGGGPVRGRSGALSGLGIPAS